MISKSFHSLLKCKSGERNRVSKIEITEKKNLKKMNQYEHKICLFCLHTKSKLYKKTSKNVEFISPSGVGLSQTIKKTQT